MVSSFMYTLDVYNYDYKMRLVRTIVCFYPYTSASLVQPWNKWKNGFNWLIRVTEVGWRMR